MKRLENILGSGGKHEFCQWLISQLLDKKHITLSEINESWKNLRPENTFMHRNTFRKKIDECLQLYGIEIIYDHHNNYWCFADPGCVECNTLLKFMLSNFSVRECFAHRLKLKDRMSLECPRIGGELLEKNSDAMDKFRQFSCVYYSFVEENYTSLVIDPWFLKLFHQRWYVIGKSHGDKKYPIRILSFDRISEFEFTGKTFKMDPKFPTVDDLLGNFFGTAIYGFNFTSEPETVKIRVTHQEIAYTDTRPFHPSQIKTYEGKDYAEYEMKVHPTWDLLMEIMLHMGRIEILKPDWYRKNYRWDVYRNWNLYKNDSPDLPEGVPEQISAFPYPEQNKK